MHAMAGHVEVGLADGGIGGQPLVRGVARDVTERKRAEKALEARSAELAAANEELEAFTYSVSHDLRTPLRHINLSAQFLLEDYGPGLGDEVLSDLRQIRETAVTAGKMVNDLLELSKLGRRKLERQPTELGALVEEVRHRLRPELNGRRVDWVIGDLPTIYCDPSLMERVLFNLLSNAIKYTRPRERAVIRVGQMVMNGQPVIFVRDNGVGFDPKQAEKLFQVFRRLHRPKEFEGTGVGLATVKRIIARHGGRVWADAEPGKGASFFFNLGPREETGGRPSKGSR